MHPNASSSTGPTGLILVPIEATWDSQGPRGWRGRKGAERAAFVLGLPRGAADQSPHDWIGRDRDREIVEGGGHGAKRGTYWRESGARAPLPAFSRPPPQRAEAPERQSEAPEGGGAPGRPPPDAYRSAPGVDAGAPAARGRGDRTLARPGPLPGTRAARAIRRPAGRATTARGRGELGSTEAAPAAGGWAAGREGIQGRTPRARLQAPPEAQLTPMARSDSWFPLRVLRCLQPLGLCAAVPSARTLVLPSFLTKLDPAHSLALSLGVESLGILPEPPELVGCPPLHSWAASVKTEIMGL